MILSNLISDKPLAAKQGGAPSGTPQPYAEAQFNEVLARVPDAPTTPPGRNGANDDQAKATGAGRPPSVDATTLAASSFLAAMSNVRTSAVPPSAGQAVTAAMTTMTAETGSRNLPVSGTEASPTGTVSAAAPGLQARLEGPATSGFIGLLAELSTPSGARSAGGKADMNSPAVTSGRRRSDPKDDTAPDAAQAVQGSAVAESPTLSSISGLLSLLPTPTAQTPANLSPAAIPSGSAKTSTAAASAIVEAGTGATPATTGATMQPSVSEGAEMQGRAVTSSTTATSEKDSAPAPTLAPIVKSVTVEAQLAPGPTLSPMQQVIDTVKRLTADEAAAAPAAAATPTVVAPTPASRTMTLVLEPDNLGTVTVRMQLRGNSLDLQLDVASSQTLGLLTRDKESLTAAMSGQDYQVGTLTMRASDTQTASQGQDNGTQNHDQRSGGSSSFQGGSPSSDGRSQPGDRGATSGGPDGDRSARQNTPHPGDDQTLRREPRSLSSNGSAGVYI